MTSPPRQWRQHNEKIKEQNERLVSDVGGSINMCRAHFGCTCRKFSSNIEYSSLFRFVFSFYLHFLLHLCENMTHLHIIHIHADLGLSTTNYILEILPQSWIPAILNSRKKILVATALIFFFLHLAQTFRGSLSGRFCSGLDKCSFFCSTPSFVTNSQS